MYCYKAHPLCDAETGLPVAVVITTGSRNDSPLLPKLIDQAPADYAWFGPAVCVGDRGYDAGSNYALLLERNIAPVLRKRDLKPGKLYYGVYADDGVPTCSDGTPLDYVRTDADTGCYVYRLSADCLTDGGGCLRRKVSRRVKGYRVCGDAVWVDPQANIRLFGYPYRRNSPERLPYRQLRGSVERMYSVWKGSSVLERRCDRGLAKAQAGYC